MKIRHETKWLLLRWEYVCFVYFFFLWDSVFGQVRYSIPEELEPGAFVGKIVEDLDLEVSKLSARRFRIIPAAQKNYLEVNLDTGILFIKERIDREQVCLQKGTCLLNVQFVVESPFEMYYAEIEILDINDNSPSFPNQKMHFSVAESSPVGARFPLESAQDIDTGTNSLANYLLGPSDKFALDIEYRGGRSKVPILSLELPLDREQQSDYDLILTAIDGGTPKRTGTLQVTIIVLDSNDNAPLFDQKIYFVNLLENVSKGTLVIKLNATDADEGSNGEVTYSFATNNIDKIKEMFSIDIQSGEIKVEGHVDFEETSDYEIEIQARDGGQAIMSSQCTVVVKVIDVNDNTPLVSINSLSYVIKENEPPGAIVALISVTDRDSDENGRIHCKISKGMPFKLKSSLKTNFYSIVTENFLDRESDPEYNITILATDYGFPSLSSSARIQVTILDINDNPPHFHQSFYTIYVKENNVPGTSIFTVSAYDPDWKENALVTYSISESITDHSISGLVSVNSENGIILASSSFDFEQLKYFSFEVQARDYGIPSLTSTTTVDVFILDQNDNAPQILSPMPKTGSTVVEANISRSVTSNFLVTKIRTYDADIGYNAWLSFELLQPTDPCLFSIGLYTGEVRTTRSFAGTNVAIQTLQILVKDNGKPPLSTTLTMAVSISDSTEDSFSSSAFSNKDYSLYPEKPPNMTLYLIITLGSISFVFILSIIILTGIQCSKYKRKTMTQTSAPYFNYEEVSWNNSNDRNCHYKLCLSQESTKSDLIFVKASDSAKLNGSGYWNSGNIKQVIINSDNGANTSMVSHML
ncbi:protocadherin-10-like [Latimeria chalumnae]|uniref:protocadherin-10-like n=1 Tax=Latimeria chalumnae TaxID=7897 RepID=UPI0006D92876|nr:PREDICTED: protocadherin-10-like [Latimeria chalumnae]|eukprot:XP_014350993.1 PREDICTED: protocadherin-10-like [Latimeria chalumnae]